MKIRVKESKHSFALWLPNFLLKSRFIWNKLAPDIDREKIKQLYKEFLRIKKRFRGLQIINVESSDGTKVTISL